MLGKEIVRIVLFGVGLSSLSAIVYLAGPFIAFGDFRPLENYIIRDIVILLLVTAAASVTGFKLWQRRKGAAQIAGGIAGDADDSDAVVLKDRMKDALATLKSASKGKATYLYDLPWYLLIGPPGSGKTTALVNSGLKFPLTGGNRPAAVAGVGGTRYCDWWFTEEAVLIDTAGRYTTQDSDAKSDQKSWFAFLDLLKKSRPRQPLNGVLVAISVEDVLTMTDTDLMAHAAAIRARLLELHTRLKVDFPVYALFTKTDLVLGFNEFFQNLDGLSREQVFGATFQTGDKTVNLVDQVPAEFDALIESVNKDMLDRLQDEPAPVTRIQLFGFPTQLAALKAPLFAFLNQIFEPTRYHVNATLRGFYFTSGTQQGTPIDQLIGALERSFGASEVAPSVYSGKGKSYFLTDLVKKVIIGEAAWVSTDRGAVRRAAILKACAYAGLIVVTAGAASLWWVSYERNDALIARTQSDVADYAKADHGLSQKTTVADHDMIQVLPLLHRLRNLPAGYADRGEPIPRAETFGLSQHDRLQLSAIEEYHRALEGLFRPRLIFRLEEVLDARKNDPDTVYAALKVYKMLGGLHKTDPALVLDWMRRDWADNLYRGEGNEAGRRELEENLQAMLDLDDGGKPRFTLSRPLLDQAETSLAQLSVAQRAYELLRSQAMNQQSDWSLLRAGGSQLPDVVLPAGAESLQSIRVPYFYTYDGFHHAFLPRLGAIADQIEKERWVLGEAAKQASFSEQSRTLPQDVLALYERDFIATWQGMLRKLRLKPFATDKTYVALGAAASLTSPIRQLFESIRDETGVTRPPKTPSAGADAKLDSGAAPLLQDGTPGAGIEEAFKGYHDMLASDPGALRPIDQLLKTLGNIAGNLRRQASSPSDVPQLNSELQLQVSDLRNLAPSLPAPFAGMMQNAAAEFDNEGVRTAHALLSQSLGGVTQACKQIVENRYPFVRGADRDVDLADFVQVFGPTGMLQQYFNANLSKYVDRSRRDWVWKSGDPVGRALSAGTLKSFQVAAQIGQAFFAGGGLTPAFPVVVTPPAVTDPNVTADINFYGTSISAQAGRSAPRSAPWPGAGDYQISITLTTGAPPAIKPVSVDPSVPEPPAAPPTPPDVSTLVSKQGVWALYHLLDDAGRGGTSVSYFSGGQTYKVQFATPSAANPLNLTLVRQFQCPGNI